MVGFTLLTGSPEFNRRCRVTEPKINEFKLIQNLKKIIIFIKSVQKLLFILMHAANFQCKVRETTKDCLWLKYKFLSYLLSGSTKPDTGKSSSWQQQFYQRDAFAHKLARLTTTAYSELFRNASVRCRDLILDYQS